jgi:hypothetical protein
MKGYKRITNIYKYVCPFTCSADSFKLEYPSEDLLKCKSVKDAPGERPLTPLDFMDDAMEDDDLAAAMAMSMEVEAKVGNEVHVKSCKYIQNYRYVL